ncbi:MAG: ABC transporter ATP-binding protein [Candidatus Competibacterales bacterium]|nr:ABC transporter ATP-binding protein [Candidatus Competibacterales bacterium]
MLEVHDLHAHYGRAHVLADLSLRIGAHESVALLGRNGAGKSTTLKCLMGLLLPTRGRILFRGQQLQGLPPHRVARLGIGYVPEDRRVFPELTVTENLAVGQRPSRESSPLWNQDRLFELFPNLAKRRRLRAGLLSGGEQQMLSIARTLMGNPSLLLLDEPSEGLAPVLVGQLAEALSDMLRQGLSLLLSEQNLGFTQKLCQRAYFIEQGRIRHQTSMAELRNNPEIHRTYLGL